MMMESTAEALPPSESVVVSIIGAGTMGAGIAVAFACAGYSVRCYARSDASAAKLSKKVSDALGMLTEVDLIDRSTREGAAQRITTHGSISASVSGAHLVVESVSESIGLKQSVLAEISACCDAATIITTNTSSLDLGLLEASVSAPARFAGLHWFYPAELVKVVEIVASPSTSEAILQRLETFAARIGKRVIHARKPVPGFVVNRLQYALLREAHNLIASGVCDAADIDASLVHCLGPRWCATGPMESMDLAGLDVHLAVAEQLYPKLANARKPHPYLIELVAAGELGAKSGRGLRGTYDGAAVTELLRRRAGVVRALHGAES